MPFEGIQSEAIYRPLLSTVNTFFKVSQFIAAKNRRVPGVLGRAAAALSVKIAFERYSIFSQWVF
jgi:hypothetical protein